MITVIDFETKQVLGHLAIGDDAVVGDTDAASEMAEAYMARVSYDPDEARAYWDGWSNGYVVASGS